MHGKEINLTGDNTTITSTNFSVDKDGNMTCNNGDFKGDIKSGSTITTPNFKVDENGNMTCGSAKITGGSVVLDSSSSDYSFRIFNNATGVTTKVTSDSLIVESNSGKGSYQDGAILLQQGGNQTSISASYASFGGDVYAKSFNPTSLQENKKNFEKFKSGLDIINNINIYKYHFKSELNNDKKHIGFVIGDSYKYSKEITSKENDGVDLYSFVSVCCKAIQEQQEQIEKLEKEIKELKGEK